VSKEERTVRLEVCESTIRTAFRRGLESTLEIVAALQRIEAEELWREREEFSDKPFAYYVKYYLKWDLQSVARIKLIDSTVRELKDANLPLPENESQVAELGRLEPDERGPLWSDLLDWSQRKEQPITVDTVRKAVEIEKQRQERIREREEADAAAKARLKQPKVGIDPDLGLGPEPEEPPKPAATRQPRSEEVEKAIDLIRKLCGNDVGAALESGALPMANKDILKWASLDPQMVKNLVYYVVNRRWSVAQAIAEESRQVDGGTTVDQLIALAKARSGRYTLTQDDAQILVDIVR